MEDVSSGDGGAALAKMVGLSGRPEWEGDEDGQGTVPVDGGGDGRQLGRR